MKKKTGFYKPDGPSKSPLPLIRLIKSETSKEIRSHKHHLCDENQ